MFLNNCQGYFSKQTQDQIYGNSLYLLYYPYYWYIDVIYCVYNAATSWLQ